MYQSCLCAVQLKVCPGMNELLSVFQLPLGPIPDPFWRKPKSNFNNKAFHLIVSAWFGEIHAQLKLTSFFSFYFNKHRSLWMYIQQSEFLPELVWYSSHQVRLFYVENRCCDLVDIGMILGAYNVKCFAFGENVNSVLNNIYLSLKCTIFNTQLGRANYTKTKSKYFQR